MQYRHVGDSGLVVSAIGLGCNNLGRANTYTEDQEGSDRIIHAALDSGITYFDVADVYGKTPGLSEKILGVSLKDRREDAIIGTKFGMDMDGANGPDFGARGSRRYIMRALEESLIRLNTDYIDIYHFHTPDPRTPIDETIGALDDLITAGKVRYIGHSNFSGWQIAQAEYVAQQLGAKKFISAQNHYNLMDRRAELEVMPAAREFRLGVFPYFPLNNGMLTGKYTGGKAPQGSRLSFVRQNMVTDADQEQLRRYSEFAKERDISEVQVAFAWLAAQNPVSSVIAGATKVEQVKQNAQALEWTPTEEDLVELDDIFAPPEKIALF